MALAIVLTLLLPVAVATAGDIGTATMTVYGITNVWNPSGNQGTCPVQIDVGLVVTYDGPGLSAEDIDYQSVNADTFRIDDQAADGGYGTGNGGSAEPRHQIMAFLSSTTVGEHTLWVKGGVAGVRWKGYDNASGAVLYAYLESDYETTFDIDSCTLQDDESPWVGNLRVSISSSGALHNSGVPVAITWAGADNLTGIDHYDLQLKTGSGPYVGLPLSDASATSLLRRLRPGSAYRIRVRGTDGDGNISPWTIGPSFTADLLQESSPFIDYTSGWRRKAVQGASGGYVRRASVAGKEAGLIFHGRAFAIVASTGPNMGRAAIIVDGVQAGVISLYSPSPANRRLVFSKRFNLSAGHTVVVRVLGSRESASSGNRIDLDAIVVFH